MQREVYNLTLICFELNTGLLLIIICHPIWVPLGCWLGYFVSTKLNHSEKNHYLTIVIYFRINASYVNCMLIFLIYLIVCMLMILKLYVCWWYWNKLLNWIIELFLICLFPLLCKMYLFFASNGDFRPICPLAISAL